MATSMGQARRYSHGPKPDRAGEAVGKGGTGHPPSLASSSCVPLAPMPLAAAYTTSKQAIEGDTGSLAHELASFGVRVKLVEPGYGPLTGFTRNTELRVEDLIPQGIANFAAPIFEAFANPAMVTREIDVAEAVFRAANDRTGHLRSPAGTDAVALAAMG